MSRIFNLCIKTFSSTPLPCTFRQFCSGLPCTLPQLVQPINACKHAEGTSEHCKTMLCLCLVQFFNTCLHAISFPIGILSSYQNAFLMISFSTVDIFLIVKYEFSCFIQHMLLKFCFEDRYFDMSHLFCVSTFPQCITDLQISIFTKPFQDRRISLICFPEEKLRHRDNVQF